MMSIYTCWSVVKKTNREYTCTKAMTSHCLCVLKLPRVKVPNSASEHSTWNDKAEPVNQQMC